MREEDWVKNPSAVARAARENEARQKLILQALELRKAGKTYREIAEIQGCSSRTALTRCKRALKKHVPDELVRSTRTLELDRFDSMTNMLLVLMKEAREKNDIDAYCKLQDRVLAISDRRAKIVPITAPIQLSVDTQVTEVTEQERELQEMLREAKVRNSDIRNVSMP